MGYTSIGKTKPGTENRSSEVIMIKGFIYSGMYTFINIHDFKSFILLLEKLCMFMVENLVIKEVLDKHKQ